MLDRLLPPSLAEGYRGHRLALWILGLLAIMKLAMGTNSIVNGRDVAGSADGIPLATFSPEAAQAVLALFAGWGLGQVVLGLLAVVALRRARGLVPLVFALLLLENVGRKAIFYFLPYASEPTTVNLVVNGLFVALMAVGLALSLGRRRAGAAA